MDLVTELYTLSEDFPSEEKFGLCSQMRRAAVSIPSDVAEGCAKESDKSLAAYLQISLGSAFELETQLELAVRLNFMKEDKVRILTQELKEIQKMITSLLAKLKKQSLAS